MLFNSYSFIFAFLPIVFFVYFRTGKYSHNLASLWLAAASVFFYGWWDARFVGLLLSSIVFNYSAAYLIGHRIARRSPGLSVKMLLVSAIAGNLMLLGYFKYANFFADNLNKLVGTDLPVGDIFLPLGISFFTFTQIAFLVDTFQGKVKEYNFVHYTLFVTYFPHLIAGPVLHHAEMMPQFARRGVCRIDWNNIAVGLSFFVLGLAKKLLIADQMGELSTPIFNAVAAGEQPMLVEAWVAALAYTLQLYFDFSAYSDMAIGLSLMFNVRLPMNFNSPYKATSIIDFWRRWHMTLSRFLRDYIYIPLGGNRNGTFQRYTNLMITMLLGGLWHGAGWTFIAWGGLHGGYLMLNHAWRGMKQYMAWGEGGRLARLGAGALTFMAIVVGWVFFRADSLSSAMTILNGMAGINGVSLPSSWGNTFGNYFLQYKWAVFDQWLPLSPPETKHPFALLTIGLAIAWGLPNVRQLFVSYRTTCDDTEETDQLTKTDTLLTRRWFHLLKWQPSLLQGTLYGLLFFVLIKYMASASESEFLYFQF